MKPTYLYIKEHVDTGLRYFGKTVKKDPLKYLGSGRYWKRHLKIHGKNVKTIWVSEPFTDKNLIVEFATFFSDCFDIVKSKNWANEKIENGIDGGRDPGFVGVPISEKIKKEYSIRMKQNNPMFNDEIKIKHKLSISTKKEFDRRKALATGNTYTKNKHWFNNGTISKMFYEAIDETWVPGRLNPHWNYNRKKHD